MSYLPIEVDVGITEETAPLMVESAGIGSGLSRLDPASEMRKIIDAGRRAVAS